MEAKITRTKGTQDFERVGGGGQTYIGNGIIASEILKGGEGKDTEKRQNLHRE
jgi:hypothetical protein